MFRVVEGVKHSPLLFLFLPRLCFLVHPPISTLRHHLVPSGAGVCGWSRVKHSLPLGGGWDREQENVFLLC